MIANYHTHTARCNHAVGSEREYIETAIARGLQVLGFADHAPQPFPGTYRSGFRMEMEQVAEYFATLKALQFEYRDKIEILIGLECEYYPELFEGLLKTVKPMGLDYLILGQHALWNEYEGYAPTTPNLTQRKELLEQYVNQTLEGLATGEYLYFAHPDMMNYLDDEGFYTAQMTKICEFCKAKDIPLEINLLGLRDNRFYPTPRFWNIAGKTGNTAVLGCDSHSPDTVAIPENVLQGELFAKQFGVAIKERLL